MKRVLKPLAVLGLLGGCLAFGFFWRDLRAGRTPRLADSLLGIKVASPKETPSKVFQQVHSRILASFFKPVKAQDVTYSGLEGLVSALGDPHTNFFIPKVATSFRDDTRGNFFGIGARLLPDPLGVKVTSVFEDGPAKAAGVRAEDLIVGVDGVNVGGKDSDEIVSMIKGKEGTFVSLKVIRPGAAEPLSFRIRRAKVIAPTVESKYLADSKVGLLRVSIFSQETPSQFESMWDLLESSGPLSGLVIDLRGNGGGVLESAIQMASLFLDNKEVVRLKTKGGEEEVSKSYSGQVKRIGYPVVVLIDDDSASASEILAGALRDYDKVRLVGTHSYGKFSVQTVYSQRDGAGVKVTIAHYYLPRSKALPRKVDDDGHYLSGGLQPDFVAELDDDVQFEWGVPEKDAQLRKAIEVLTGPRDR